ncbi:phosphatidate cytidylyltransferase [Methyloligella sp. 2.7D]|uniref:phosphatidate cytidylyltransferase n=1 Tax=unclassified Methyloligella TaxID=2625955 RepID=UPI00157CED27|nr:phosphatidate cytidylyltransferase [Methyloligella sp. GL2]QKP77524.1 phosphatidate cytidylyltransferase [Methyloligella sp. GL2]
MSDPNGAKSDPAKPDLAKANLPTENKSSRELATRAFSAVVMAAGAIAAVLVGVWAFALLIIAGSLIVNWEWSRLVRGEGADRLAVIHAATILAVVVFMAVDRPAEAALVLAVALGVTLIIGRGKPALIWSTGWLVYFSAAAAAFIWLRTGEAYGITSLLFLFAIAWTADTCAYAGGKLIGGPKLAPKISPNKTWAGFLCGVSLPALVGIAFALGLDTSWVCLALIAMVLALACQLGDLTESGVKRLFGAKDTGKLIPGHGGLLDRIDGLMLAGIVAALIALRNIPHPGQGLLLW